MDNNLNDYFGSINLHQYTKKFEWKTGMSYDYKGATSGGTVPIYSYAFGEQFPTVRLSRRQQIQNPEVYAYVKFNVHRQWVMGTGVRKNISVFKNDDYTSFGKM